jgi:hypothetical protein
MSQAPPIGLPLPPPEGTTMLPAGNFPVPAEDLRPNGFRTVVVDGAMSLARGPRLAAFTPVREQLGRGPFKAATSRTPP